jgi:hypothetical protein
MRTESTKSALQFNRRPLAGLKGLRYEKPPLNLQRAPGFQD